GRRRPGRVCGPLSRGRPDRMGREGDPRRDGGAAARPGRGRCRGLAEAHGAQRDQPRLIAWVALYRRPVTIHRDRFPIGRGGIASWVSEGRTTDTAITSTVAGITTSRGGGADSGRRRGSAVRPGPEGGEPVAATSGPRC